MRKLMPRDIFAVVLFLWVVLGIAVGIFFGIVGLGTIIENVMHIQSSQGNAWMIREHVATAALHAMILLQALTITVAAFFASVPSRHLRRCAALIYLLLLVSAPLLPVAEMVAVAWVGPPRTNNHWLDLQVPLGVLFGSGGLLLLGVARWMSRRNQRNALAEAMP